MANVLLDTNVLLDFFSRTRPEHDRATALMQHLRLCEVGTAVAATSVKDIYYILGRTDGKGAAQAAVESVLGTMAILPVDADCCQRAAHSTEPDFEDGIIRAAAEIAQVDYLISRDSTAFVGSRVPRLTPAEALRELRPRPSRAR